MARKLLLLVAGCCLITGTSWAYDAWDATSPNDNAAGGNNRLIHGTRQVHYLEPLAGPAADQDWFGVYSGPYKSFEVITDGYSGQVAVPTRYAADGTTSEQNGSLVEFYSGAYSLRWMNTSSAGAGKYVLVEGSASGDLYDRYEIRAYETTISLARFNNSGTQTTVLICQNPTASSIAAREYFWNEAGTLLATNSVTIAARATSVVSGVALTTGQKGSVTVAHDGPYGSLNCKSVALEPSTGFSFDTPGVYRP